MKERIFRTPRTYGSPSGYDVEITHYPNGFARMSEQLIQAMLEGGDSRDAEFIAARACDLTAALRKEWEARDWMIAVEDAPGMKRDPYRGSAE